AATHRSPRPSMSLELDDLRIDESRLLVAWNGSTIHLPPREMAAMLALASDPGAPVTSAELARRIWPGSAMVTAYDVRRVIHELRARLRTSEVPARIRNVHGVGYELELDPPEPTRTLSGHLPDRSGGKNP